jgi:hypothetical protein
MARIFGTLAQNKGAIYAIAYVYEDQMHQLIARWYKVPSAE